MWSSQQVRTVYCTVAGFAHVSIMHDVIFRGCTFFLKNRSRLRTPAHVEHNLIVFRVSYWLILLSVRWRTRGLFLFLFVMWRASVFVLVLGYVGHKPRRHCWPSMASCTSSTPDICKQSSYNPRINIRVDSVDVHLVVCRALSFAFFSSHVLVMVANISSAIIGKVYPININFLM